MVCMRALPDPRRQLAVPTLVLQSPTCRSLLMALVCTVEDQLVLYLRLVT